MCQPHDHPSAFLHRTGAEGELRCAQEIAVLADAHQPPHGIDPPVGAREQIGFGRAAGVSRLGEDLHHLQHRIRQPRAEHEALVLGQAIHAVQHPLHVVIPLGQRDRQVGREHALFRQNNLARLRRNRPATGPFGPPKRKRAKGQRSKGPFAPSPC